MSDSVDCVVLDAGARYGLHPTWASLRSIARFHLFEMDPAEADRLARKYAGDANITVHPVALFSRDTTLKIRVAHHRALNSLYEHDKELLRRNNYMTDSFAEVDELDVPARTIDAMFRDSPVHFFKLDIEGAELDALHGARNTLGTSVLGVRSEVCFAPIYKGAALFGEIHQFLLDQGMELLNLDYSGKGNLGGRFASPDRYGKLVSSDAVWVVGNDRLFAGSAEERMANVVRLSAFLFLNDAADLAVDTMLNAVNCHNVSFAPVRESPLFRVVHRMALLHFKKLTTLPMFRPGEISDAYQNVFGEEFPALNRFYESDIFS